MNDINHVVVSGRVVKEIELRKTPSGVPVCDMYFANNRRTKNRQHSVFLQVTLWNLQAEWIAANVHVGDTVLVEGVMVDNNFERKDTGEKTSGRVKIDNAKVNLLKKRDAEPITDEEYNTLVDSQMMLDALLKVGVKDSTVWSKAQAEYDRMVAEEEQEEPSV